MCNQWLVSAEVLNNAVCPRPPGSTFPVLSQGCLGETEFQTAIGHLEGISQHDIGKLLGKMIETCRKTWRISYFTGRNSLEGIHLRLHLV